MLATHADAESRYHKLRKEALRATAAQVPSGANLDFKLIDGEALRAFRAWAGSSRRLVDWDWISGYHSFKFRFPKRFELALSHKNSLASLTLGRPTYRGTALRMDFIERNPDYGKVSVVQPALVAMTVYADALGADELRIMNPINEEVKDYYQRFGLTYVAKGDYLFSRL